jgi:hypothetical protein
LIEQLKNTTGMSSYNNRKHGTSNFRQATHKMEESAGSEQNGDGVPARAWPIAMNGKSESCRAGWLQERFTWAKPASGPDQSAQQAGNAGLKAETERFSYVACGWWTLRSDRRWAGAEAKAEENRVGCPGRRNLGQKLKTTSEKQEMPAERILVASERAGNEERAALFWLSHCLPTEKLDLTERWNKSCKRKSRQQQQTKSGPKRGWDAQAATLARSKLHERSDKTKMGQRVLLLEENIKQHGSNNKNSAQREQRLETSDAKIQTRNLSVKNSTKTNPALAWRQKGKMNSTITMQKLIFPFGPKRVSYNHRCRRPSSLIWLLEWKTRSWLTSTLKNVKNETKRSGKELHPSKVLFIGASKILNDYKFLVPNRMKTAKQG